MIGWFLTNEVIIKLIHLISKRILNWFFNVYVYVEYVKRKMLIGMEGVRLYDRGCDKWMSNELIIADLTTQINIVIEQMKIISY